MAKKASKATDNSSDPLTAVEEALKINFEEEANADAVEESVKAENSKDTVSNEVEIEESAPKAAAPVEKKEVVSPKRPPANDDRRAGSTRLLASLNRRPSSLVLWVAFLFSAAWVFGASWAGFKILGTKLLDISAWASILDNPTLIYFAGSLIVPVLLIWGYAIMIRRAQELKLAARSMTEAAYRLIEPEIEAEDTVRSVGQAVRMEVSETIPPRAITAISLVPPPISIIMFPIGSRTSIPIPIAAAIGS